MGKDIGIGLIGLGMGANVFLAHDDPNSRLHVNAVCDVDRVRAEEVAEEKGVGFVTTDHRELVSRDEVDVVAVFTPDHLHAEQCIDALSAGKHVVCTKPMVGQPRGEGLMDALESIIALVRERRVKFLVGQTMRFDPEFRACKRLYDDGDLGRGIVALAHYVHDFRNVGALSRWRTEVPQDLLFGGASHPVDVLRWIFGDVAEVHCYGIAGGITAGYPTDYEDSFLLNMCFESGVIAQVVAAFGICHPPMPMMGLSIFGSTGSVRADYTDFKGGHLQVVTDRIQGVPGELPILTTSFPPVTLGAYGHGKAVIQYLRHLEDCIVNDRQPSPDALEGARCISTCMAAWESVRTGKPIKVRNTF